MRLLVIYCNHDSQRDNFNSKLLENIRHSAQKLPIELKVRDLYDLKFEAVLNKEDFELMSMGKLPKDIETEQNFIRWADAIMFIYPIWWGGMPAILKGYIDKVFSWGFAYGKESGKIVPLLSGKKVSLINTLGQSREQYEKGMFQAMNRINAEGIFDFCGMEIVHQLYISSVHFLTPTETEEYFAKAASILSSLKHMVTTEKAILRES